MLIPLLKLYIAIFVILFVPGYFFVMALFGRKRNKISLMERYLLFFGLSITAINAIFLFLNFLEVPLNRSSILTSIIIFSLLCFTISKRSFLFSQNTKQKESTGSNLFSTLNSWSYRHILIFVVILLLAVGFRAFYISQGIMPKTTDLGHHMYWSKYIVDLSVLPEYGMPDFIIGEHIIFSAISILSEVSFISAMPVAVLLIVNIFSLLAIFVLTYRFSELLFNKKHTKQIALFSLLIIGCFYAISSPQSKFVSGGVIGNIIGNLFIPLAIYSLLQAIKHKDVLFAQLFIIFADCPK